MRLSHNGIPAFWSSNIASNTGYLLNFDQIECKYLDPEPVEGDFSQKVVGSSGKTDKYEQKYKQCAAFCERASGRSGYVSNVIWAGQWQFNPKYQGQFKKYTA